jgi:hypothetical protein
MLRGAALSLSPSPWKSSTTATSSSTPVRAAASARIMAALVSWLDAEPRRGTVAASPRPAAEVEADDEAAQRREWDM